MMTVPVWFIAPFLAALGAAIGSFGNVVAYRVPRHESIISPRSRCPRCSHQLGTSDNVPVLSWFWLRGRCRYCHAPVTPRYVIVETVTAVLFVAMARRFGVNPVLPAYLALASSLVILSSVDAERHLIPNRILYPAAAIFVVLLIAAAPFIPGGTNHLLGAAEGAVAAFDVMFVIYAIRPDGLGFGDVRLSALLGGALGLLGLVQVAIGLFLGFAFGAAYGIAAMIATRRGASSRIPFAPFLSAGAVVAVLVGSPLARWWLG